MLGTSLNSITRDERQEAARVKWIKSKCRGTFEFATGFGKTFTAIKCVKSVIERYQNFRVLVVVPTDNLRSQWIQQLDQNGLSLNADVQIVDRQVDNDIVISEYQSEFNYKKLELSEIYEAPTSGITLQLSIDLDLQLAIENELDNVVAKYNPNSVIALAMNPNTGEILASSARPNFNNNNYKSSCTAAADMTSTAIIIFSLPIREFSG